MIKKYFEANVEDAVRIAVIEAETDDAIYTCPEASEPNREIEESELPADFANWQRYTAHAYHDAAVDIMSRNGD